MLLSRAVLELGRLTGYVTTVALSPGSHVHFPFLGRNYSAWVRENPRYIEGWIGYCLILGKGCRVTILQLFL